MLKLNNFIVLKVDVLDKFAARLNSFKVAYRDYWPGKNINTFYLLTRASKAGINAADLNFPDHFEKIKLQVAGTKINLPNVKKLENGPKIIIGIRPKYLFPSNNGIPAKIAVVERTGSETYLLLRASDQDLTCVIRERENYSPGQEVKLTTDQNSIHIFNYENKLRIY